MLFFALWPGCLAALGLGLLLGWAMPVRGRAIPIGLTAATLSLAAVAALGLVPGAAGLWLESAAVMLAAYVAGCGVGVLGRTLRARRPSAGSRDA